MSKILIILPALGGGGAERLHVNLANDWVQKGHKVELVLMRKAGGRSRELLPLLSSKISIMSFDIKFTPQIILPLTKYLRKSTPDVTLVPMWPITSYSIISWLLSKKIGKLYISDHINLTSSIKNQNFLPQFYLNCSIKYTYHYANGIIAVSEGVRENLSKIGNLNKDKIKVIHNPVITNNPSYRESKEIRNKLWGGNYTYNILSVGSLKKQKDHETLLKAFSLLSKDINTKLIILGEGELRQKLYNTIKKLDLKNIVDLPGFVIDPLPWFRSADIFVLSSKWEGFGNVIVEALECGVPVVSTDCPSGPSEILDNGRYGLLTPIGNPKDLALAIKKSLLENHNKIKLINRAKDFSISKISNRYLKYMECI